MKWLTLCIVALTLTAAPAPARENTPKVLPRDVQATPRVEKKNVMALREKPALNIASAYGFADWNKIKRIDFTFHARLPGKDKTVDRRWTWWPGQDKVMLHRKRGEALTYTRGRLDKNSPDDLMKADKHFINDSYWLLFPFQIVWSNPKVTAQGTAKLPIARGAGQGERGGRARKVVVKYPAQGGYTPGDAYELYLDDHDRIAQWVYHQSGMKAHKKVLKATWEKYRRVGPILLSLEHRGPDRKFHLWFTDVSVRVAGEDHPLTPQPLHAAAHAQP